MTSASAEAEVAEVLANMMHSGVTAAPAKRATSPAAPQTIEPEVAPASTAMADLIARNGGTAASPRVRAAANRRGVDLSAIDGTGVGGRITVVDVEAAAPSVEIPRPHAAASPPPATTTRPSRFLPLQSVDVDEYGPNPLADDLRQVEPQRYEAALKAGLTPPTLFESGDLPVFTAAGIPIESLARLPWPVRNVVARLDDADAVYLVNKFTPGPTSDRSNLAQEALGMFASDPENQAYESRIKLWLDDNLVWDHAAGSWVARTRQKMAW